MQKDWRVYLLRCKDGSLYCGITNDVARRMLAHMNGVGSKYVRSRGYQQLQAVSPPMSRRQALRLEHGVKRLRKDKKPTAVHQGRLPDGKVQKTR